MKTMQLGTSSLQVTRIAQGCMRLSPERAEAMRTVHASLDAGITFFDHADVYGSGQCEATFSALWDGAPHLRQDLILQSKVGIRRENDPVPGAPWRFDFSYEHIIEGVEGSLRRLKTDYLDVLLLHRPDPLVEPEEVARAFDQLYAQGKVRHFGVSNHTAAQIALLKRWVEKPLITNQLEVSLAHTHLMDEGVIMNRADTPEATRNEDTLEYCRLHDITIQAWSPLAAGLLSGKPLPAGREYLAGAAELVKKMAHDKGVQPEAILIAWILRHPAHIQAIIGTTNPERIAACCQADALDLTREEWYTLYTAGRGRRVP